MFLRNSVIGLAILALAAPLGGCAAQAKQSRSDGGTRVVKVRPKRDKASLRAEVDRVLAGGKGGQRTPDEDVALETELLAKLEKRLDQKLGAKVDPAYDTETEFDVAFETAMAQELDVPLAEGEVPIVEQSTGQMVGVYSEATGEVTPLLAGTEDELVASIFQDSGADAEFGGAAAEAPRFVPVRDGLRDVHYAFDRYTLSDEARLILQQNAEFIRGIDGRVVIEGHCDSRGSVEYNLALGEKRARSAYDYLVTLGVDPDRIDVISYGEERPLDAGDNEIAWAKNRRAHFRAGGAG